MVAVLLYAHCQRIRSSRRIARALEEDAGFRVVAASLSREQLEAHLAEEEATGHKKRARPPPAAGG